MDDMLLKKRISVESEGELVVIRVGSAEMKMHYTEALKLQQWIRIRAKEVKRAVGDTNHHWSVVGLLDAQR